MFNTTTYNSRTSKIKIVLLYVLSLLCSLCPSLFLSPDENPGSDMSSLF